MNETSLSDLNCARLTAVVGTEFQVSVGGEQAISLKLSEVKQHSPRADGSAGRGEAFSLLFAGPRTHLLPQRLYQFAHETLGRFELFIVPVGQDATSFHYEAVFNRM